jgi:hypothetical protein
MMLTRPGQANHQVRRRGDWKFAMDSFAIETLMVFYDGLFRPAKSGTVVVLRSLALGCVVSGPAFFGLASLLTEDVQSYPLISGTVCLLAFLVLTLWCASIVNREQRKE